MKALEILKRICNHGSATVIEIKESIEELEALENRSCNNCVYNLSDNGNFHLYPCSECSRFYADSWSNK